MAVSQAAENPTTFFTETSRKHFPSITPLWHVLINFETAERSDNSEAMEAELGRVMVGYQVQQKYRKAFCVLWTKSPFVVTHGACISLPKVENENEKRFLMWIHFGVSAAAVN
ncbi:hypothetical protein OIDMADRAFT_47564 [Oidiodendron maius Zn]|uniref:Uncharacterized protein n=1 Tax=Oidiodendron maius (strain Zn) TaxID=913774 RepID=A0A0C3HZQ4_OIDMZ|nr:hypothetical protein OIDMADRAFT_47564 [Oidiodendron maius Zn]